MTSKGARRPTAEEDAMKHEALSRTFGLALALAVAGPALAQDLPGEGKTVRMAQPTWDTEWFQAQIYKKVAEQLGYAVEDPIALDNPPFYEAVGLSDIDFWASGWFPLHNTYITDLEGKASAAATSPRAAHCRAT
jgi:ABC-type proline/glycine betaine transport system substrate-binding protein